MHELEPLVRLPEPLIRPAQVTFIRATGAFNPAAVVEPRSDRVVLLFRVFEAETRRSCLGLALSSDGLSLDEVWDRPVLSPAAPYEAWGVEDARVTYLEDEGRYAITYTGYSPAGPRVCLATTDDILDPSRYRRHGPRIAGENKDCVIFPEKRGGRYALLHRPLPRIVYAEVPALEGDDLWPEDGVPLIGPRPDTWRSARVGAGPPPLRTPLGWLLAFHGTTQVEEGNVYCMGWCVLDATDPSRVLYVSPSPVLTPETPYEIQHEPIPQVDMANFPDGVRVVFPEGMVERGEDLLVYYGAADVNVGVARVNKADLLASLEAAIARGEGASPL